MMGSYSVSERSSIQEEIKTSTKEVVKDKVVSTYSIKSSDDFFESDRSNTGSNRWPKQETVALLQIRFAMDDVFRDSSLKAPLWEHVSRKMAELGYLRSSKKCKEKFENVYKYHKRTKDSRVGKSDGKTYRFFDQLEALDQYRSSISPLPPPAPCLQAQEAVPVTMVYPVVMSNQQSVTVTSSPHNQHAFQYQVNVASMQHVQSQPQQPRIENGSSPSATQSSSSKSSDEDVLGGRRKRKRKWEGFVEKMMKKVVDKQEELQKRFLDTVEKRERDKVARDEAWMAQEMSRLNRQHEMLAQERSMAAAKDAALIHVLKKFADQTQTQTQTHDCGAVRVSTSNVITTQVQPRPQPQPQQFQPKVQAAKVHDQEHCISLPVLVPVPTRPQPQIVQLQALAVLGNTANTNVDAHKTNNSGENNDQASPSRWPKAEVEALINLRSKMDLKYQENGPKGPLWEEMSSLMNNLGYNRNAKRCKEKWENINKYYKKVKESNRKRPEDSKTCPYFHQLDALYQQKTNIDRNNVAIYAMKPGNLNSMGHIMAQPEQQWHGQGHRMEDAGSGNDSHNDGDEDGDGDEEDDDDDQGSGVFEIVANTNRSTSNNNGVTTTS